MAGRGLSRDDVASAVGKRVRTITNWTTGSTLPDEIDRAILRRMFPGYDDPGDQVQVAVMSSRLTEDRKFELVGVYKRLLREQDESLSGTSGQVG